MGYPHNDNDNNARDRGRDEKSDKKEFELYPEATYPVVAVGHRFGWTSNKNPQVGIRLRIVEGPLKDKTLLYYGTFTDAAQEYTIKALRALGMYGDDVEKDIGQIYNGTVANAVYAHEVYEGKKRGKVNWINGADVVMNDEMDQNELKTFSSRLRGAMKRFPGGGHPPAEKTSQPAQQQREQPRDNRREEPRREQQSFQRPAGRNEPPPPSDDDAPWQSDRRR